MEATPSSASILDHFNTLADPRREHLRRHDLYDVLVIAFCAVIAHCDSWEQIAAYGRDKADWFKTFLRLPNGIPSHDTFHRVFNRLQPDALRTCVLNWIAAVADVTEGRVVPIDGKTLRGSLDQAGGKAALHLVSAWAAEQHLTLGQVATEAKSNEITAIPKLLEILDLEGAIVTIDAMGCQKDIATDIRAAGADYVLQLKANHENLHLAVQEAFLDRLDSPDPTESLSVFAGPVEVGHGRQEQRTVYALAVPTELAGAAEWRDLKTLVLVHRVRTVGTKTSEEFSYYLSSLAASAEAFGRIIRLHWRIENNLHWVLDVTFGEDANRNQAGHGAENLGLYRRLALSLLKQEPSKDSLKCKRLRAGWNNDFLLRILLGFSGNRDA